MVQALILAAGRGSRLGDMTKAQPKGMVTLLGKPLLHWSRAALTEVGASPIHMVGGYAAEMLQAEGWDVTLNPRWAETNMVGSLLCAAEFIQRNTTIVSYSDIVYHPDHVRALMASGGDITITYDTAWQNLWQQRFSDPLSDAENFRLQDGLLQEIGAKSNSLAAIDGQFMGLLKFTPAGWNTIAAYLATLSPLVVDKLDMTSLLAALLQQNIPIHAVAVTGRWCEIDNQNDLRLAEDCCAKGNWPHDWRWA
jgi:choline kinase